MAPKRSPIVPVQANAALWWTLAGAALVILLPWLQRWLYIYPELDYRLFLGRDFLELTSQRAYFYRGLAEGKLLLWDPLMATGLPFMEYLFDLFNPLSLLNTFFLEGGLLRSDYLQVVLTAYCSLAAFGAFMLGLQLGLGRAAATVMGVVMGCMGVVTAHSEHSMMIQTFCWAPLVLLFLHRARHGKSLINAAWAGLFLGWSFMGGIPQIFYYVGLGASIYCLYAAIDELQTNGWRSAWRRGALPFLLMAGASLIWALPNLVHLAQTLGDPIGAHDTRALVGAQRRDFIAQGSGDWWVLFYFLAPRLLQGHAENTAYVGLIPLALAMMAVVWVRGREAGFYKLLGLLGIVLMMGNNLGLHKVLVDVLPGYGLFRETVRWMFLLHLALLVLAGFGLRWLMTQARPPELAALRRVLAVMAAIIFGTLLLSMAVESSGLLPYPWRYTLPLASLLTWLLFNLGVIWWAVVRRSQEASPRLVALVLVALVALDLGFYHTPVMVGGDPVRRSDPTRPKPAQEAAYRELARLAGGPERGRVLAGRGPDAMGYQYPIYLTHLDFINPPGGYMDRRLPLGFWQTWRRSESNPRFLNLWAVKLVAPDSPMVDSHCEQWFLCGYSQSAVRLDQPGPVAKLRLVAEAPLAGQARPGEEVARVALADQGRITAAWPLRLGKEVNGQSLELTAPAGAKGDTIILSSTHPKAMIRLYGLEADGRFQYDRPNLKPGPRGMLVNRDYLGRAWFVSRAAVVEPIWEYLHVLKSADPSRTVVFRKAPPGWRAPQGQTADPGGRVAVESWDSQNARLKVSARRPGWLVLSQSAYHGWSAQVDGQAAPIRQAYGFLQAVAVPAGEHQVTLVYDEPLVKASLAVPPLLVLGLVGGGLWLRRRRKAKRA
ncbi:MAG: YfhO family protein [Desulfarculaceae bacterium]|nr:YfhO family protein [Desulfarculaceae bacterium]